MSAAELELLRQQVRALQEQIGRHGDALAALEDGLADAAVLAENSLPTSSAELAAEADEAEDAEGDEAESSVPDLAVLVPWVQENISSWCERDMAKSKSAARGLCWCPQWFKHPEAVTRLWVMRAAQLAAAAQGPVEVSAYLRDHFDPHMAVLTGDCGPFHACSGGTHLREARTGQNRFLPTDHLASTPGRHSAPENLGGSPET